MREFYTTAEATKDNFLFVSYSHDDKEIVHEWVDYLIDQGVRVWCDKAFLGGDDWETIATELLSHDKCSGFLFFCSKSAIESPNVAKEWRVAAKTKETRPEGTFYPQIIMADSNPDFDYSCAKSLVKKTEELFSDDDYDDFRNLFGKKDHIFYSASAEPDKAELLQNIKSRAPQTVDENAIICEKLADLSKSGKDVILNLGTYNNKPITWHKISDEGNNSILLSLNVLANSHGGEMLDSWIEQFLRQSFDKDKQIDLQGKIRLLTSEEAQKLSQEELSCNKIWWLAESVGHLQTVVREDGTIYVNGYNNKLYAKGVRPVIAIDSRTLYSLLNK